MLADTSLQNVALLGNHMCFFWQGVSLEVVASYMKKSDEHQVVVTGFARCNVDELAGLVQSLSIH